MSSRLKEIGINLSLVLVSCVVGYLLIEIIFFRVLLTNWPPAIRTYLPRIADIMAQNTKSGAMPHDYIAIFGDSYAVGAGDWLLANNGDRRLPFQATNIIHDRLRRDVVSFGLWNIGNDEAFVRIPSHVFEASKCYFFPAMEEPAQIVAYFYEGNDVGDNLRFLSKVQAAYGATSAPQIDAYLSRVHAEFAPWRCHIMLSDTVVSIVGSYVEALIYGQQFFDYNAIHANVLLLANKTRDAPPLQGPPVWLSDQQIDAGVLVFERSLAWVRRRFAGVPVFVVYIPGPASVYRFADETVALSIGEPKTPSGKVKSYNAQICELIRRSSVSQGAGFVDATPAFRAAAYTQLLHGPRDWAHINRVGYTVLGTLIADQLKDRGTVPDRGCATN